ncbi:MAG: carbohydrate ABC transporter permease [Armatimonadota bacterium]|nr:carbohydrate ABC transporter permease [Armatimonadota bacterium]MDR7402081.1 carbohydrate ABC transporter permease [Armatimonadota bacterium]MDR7437093.1 carbohydrate ABC transporter permease [Armatimonadota bacterium]MDR7472438.1 carbohydrate ABC transporter permease [Armatimonadota bacterium]MDR7506657.1 carbohydrate ABC transporter permease [Armatimonadota bacterium]
MTLRRVAVYAAVLAIAAWVALPLLLITLAAFTPREVLYQWPRPLWPSRFSLDTLAFFLRSTGVWPATLRSVQVAVLTIALSLALAAPAGYALARYAFRGREALQLLILSVKMFPATVLSVPLAVAFIRWGLYDTVVGVAAVHTALSVPFVTAIVTSVFAGVSYELEEAALTLGSSRAQAVLRVTLPMAAPGLAAAAIFTFVLSWNEVFAATILTLDRRTLPALIVDSVLGAGAPLPFRFAGGFFMVVPALIIIFLIRRYLLTLWGVTVR